MVNLNVGYAGPVPAALTLWNEIVARWGSAAQNKGFVAGSGATTWNITSHNADNLGRAHALDIGVDIELDGSGIPEKDAIDLAEHLRSLGHAEWASGKAGRLAYIIYRKQIAGDHTGWAWTPYTGASPHYDHIHVSFSFDFAWGDSVWEATAEYNSTASWGVASILSGFDSGIEVIQEDTLSAAEVYDIQKFTQQVINEGITTAVKEIREGSRQVGDTIRTENYDNKVFCQKVMNTNGDRIIVEQRAQVAGLVEALKQVSKAQGSAIDIAAVLEAARAGAAQAISEGVVKVDVSVSGGAEQAKK